MQDTCIYQAPVEVGELKKKKKKKMRYSIFGMFCFYYYYYLFVALKKNTFTYKETFIVSYQNKH